MLHLSTLRGSPRQRRAVDVEVAQHSRTCHAQHQWASVGTRTLSIAVRLAVESLQMYTSMRSVSVNQAAVTSMNVVNLLIVTRLRRTGLRKPLCSLVNVLQLILGLLLGTRRLVYNFGRAGIGLIFSFK